MVTSDAPGFVTLGDIGPRLPVLEVACTRGDRRGRLRVDRLMVEHGLDATIQAAGEPQSLAALEGRFDMLIIGPRTKWTVVKLKCLRWRSDRETSRGSP